MKLSHQTLTKPKTATHPLITPRERLLIWEKARGIWKNRKPHPIKELKTIRKEWERKLAR